VILELNDQPVQITHLWRRIGEHTIVFSDAFFNIRRFDFNEIGSLVWEMIDGKRDINCIIKELSLQFPDEKTNSIQNTVLDFINELENEWLLHSQKTLKEYE